MENKDPEEEMMSLGATVGCLLLFVLVQIASPLLGLAILIMMIADKCS